MTMKTTKQKRPSRRQSSDFQVKLSIVKNIRQIDDLLAQIAKLGIYPACKQVMP